jgi:hypothetical protein
MITEAASPTSIASLETTHASKVHYIPVKYRVLGGVLQALNIKFGAFIEELIALVVERDTRVNARSESGTKLRLAMTAQTDARIDQYITSRQVPGHSDTCDEDFQRLLADIISLENQEGAARQEITKDVDALFVTEGGQIIYLEVKYNDDHDTGKFVDINRKFIKTYAGLVHHLGVTQSDQLKPILYYFNPTVRWPPIYVPGSNIYRGARLFDEYFEIRYAEINEHLANISNDESILAMLDEVYVAIRERP